MKPNSKNLSSRDAALSALVGAIGTPDFGVEFGGDYDPAEMGVEFGADAPAGPAPSASQLQAMWRAQQSTQRLANQRAMLLEPNKGSHVKVERYSFSVSQDITLGTASPISASSNPATSIRAQRVTMNAPSPGFATITDIKVANVSALVGGIEDAYGFNANAVGQHLDLPTLTPANRLTVSGQYTGLVPTGFTTATNYTFVASFRGPASIVA